MRANTTNFVRDDRPVGTPAGPHAAIRIQHPQHGLPVFYPVAVTLPTGNPGGRNPEPHPAPRT